jgi:hypothetical protein
MFLGYFMINSSETIGKAEDHRQSEAIALAKHSKNIVGLSMPPLS